MVDLGVRLEEGIGYSFSNLTMKRMAKGITPYYEMEMI